MKKTSFLLLKVFALHFLLLFSNLEAQNNSKLLNIIISPDDSAASFHAYEKMMHSDPNKLSKFLSNKENVYHLRENKNIRRSDARALLNVSKMIHFCKENNIPSYSISLYDTLMGLNKGLDLYEQYKKEYSILSTLGIDDIQSLEYYAFLYGSYGTHVNLNLWQFDVSMNKIIDILYEQHWDKIIENDNLLRFYVYKCMIFMNSGHTGHSLYYRRFKNQSIHVRDRLVYLYEVEKSKELKQAFMVALHMLEFEYPNSKKLNISIPIKDYLDNKGENIQYSNNLVILNDEDLEYVFSKLKKLDARYDVFYFIDKYASYKATPYLIKLFNDKRTYSTSYTHVLYRNYSSGTYHDKVTIAEKALESLQKIFQCDFPLDNNFKAILTNETTSLNTKKKHMYLWSKYWKKNKDNVANWENLFKINQADVIEINNKTIQLIKNNELTIEQRNSILEQIDKQNYLPKEILIMVEKTNIHYSDYSQILNKIDHSDEKFILEHLLSKLKSYEEDKQGLIIETLLNSDWFKTTLIKNKSNRDLISFLEEKYRLTNPEYSYGNKSLYFIETMYMNSNERLNYLIQNQLIKNHSIGEEYFRNLPYKNIPSVLKKWNDMEIKHKYVARDIITDFIGIALPIIDNPSIEQLILDIESMNEFSMRCKYLEKANMPVLNNKGLLNFNLIYRYLLMDYSECGFVTRGNSEMQELISPVIRLLENHFHSDKKSVHYWLKYLEENKLVTKENKSMFTGNFSHSHINDSIYD